MKWLICFSFLLSVSLASAQQYVNNDTIVNFSLSDVSSKREFELEKVEEDYLVIVFISNQCSFVDQYIGRLKELDTTYSSVRFVLVNVYSKTDVNENHMSEYLNKHNWQMSYLKDRDRKLYKSFGVQKVPEVCLMAKLNDRFVLKYKGAIDDNPQSQKGVTKEYLKEAIDKTISNVNASHKNTRAMGCREY